MTDRQEPQRAEAGSAGRLVRLAVVKDRGLADNRER